MKKLAMLLTGMLMVVSLVACSSQKPEGNPVETPKKDETVETENMDAKKDNLSEEEVFTFEGHVEEKRDFTIIVFKGEETYIFNLPEGFETEATSGSNVRVTYTGDKNDIDSQLQVVDIEIIE